LAAAIADYFLFAAILEQSFWVWFGAGGQRQPGHTDLSVSPREV